MLKRVIVIGVLAGAPLAALAQQAEHPGPGARFITTSPISPPASQLPPPVEPTPAKLPLEAAPVESQVEKVTPATTSDIRGTEQAPLAVKIIPSPATASDLAQTAAARREKSATYVWLALLTAAVAVIALFQLIALTMFIATTRRHQRAYVFASGAEIVDLEIGGAPIVQIEIKNSGQTPAYELTHAWRCGVFDYPLQQKLLLPHNNDPVSWPHLGPGASAQARRAAEKKQIANGGAVELTNRAVAFFVYGEIRYRDTFNKIRFTRYVFYHTGMPRMGPGQLIAYEKGNEAN
jgi:hypothetical protein